MNRLEVPETFSGIRIKSHETIRVKIVALAITAVEIVARSAERHENDAVLRIDSHLAPVVDTAGSGQIFGGPGLRARFARAGDAVEGPFVFTREDIKGANV